MYYLRKICCVCLSGDKMLIKSTSLNPSVMSFYFKQIIQDENDSVKNELHFCMPCFKTLKFYNVFTSQCKKNKNTIDSYVTELTNYTELNLGLFDITVNITDIDPAKKVTGTIRTKPNIDLSNNDLKLDDIFDSYVENKEVPTTDIATFARSLNLEVNGEFGTIIAKEEGEDDDEEELVIEDLDVLENGDQLEYEEVSYDDDNSESYLVDLNELSRSTEPVKVLAPKLTEMIPNLTTSNLRHRPKKKIFRFSSLSSQSTCTICNKKFQNRSHLETHLLTHSDIRPFACDLCDKRFRQRAHLRTHKMIHFDIKPFTCHLCNKSFRQKAHLNAHILLHSDEKLFRCDICEKFYRSQANLRFHRSSQHRMIIQALRAS